MLNFAFRRTPRPTAQGFQRRRHNTSHILEPILTPSGLVDMPGDEIDCDPAEAFVPELDDTTLKLASTEVVPEPAPDIDLVPFITEVQSLGGDDLPFTSGVFTVGETGQVDVDFLFDGGFYSRGEVAIFSLEGLDADPGTPEFVHEAASRALSGSELGHVVISDATQGALFSGSMGEGNFNSGEYDGATTVQMKAGDRFGIMLAANHTIEEVQEGKTWSVRFSMATANPDDNFQFGQIGDVTGDGNTFAFEDLDISGKADRDYNDIVFQIHGATGEVADVDELIEGTDWREGELGQEILDYAASQIAEREAVDITPVLSGELNEAVVNEILPTIETDLDTLEEQFRNLAPDVEIPDDPELEAITEPTDENFEILERKLEEAIAELEAEGFADVTALASSYDFDTADQPLIGVIDTGFAEGNTDIDSSRIIWGNDHIDNDDYPLLPSDHEDANHGTQILEVIAATQNNNEGIDGVNDDAPLWLGRAVGSGKWADSLVEFVDAAKASNQPNAVVNLSFDLAHEDGTPRTFFTPGERAALEYAQANNVLIVAAAGNGGVEQLSALGLASEEFGNIITVGAANGEAQRADYSNYGEGLDLLAYGTRAADYDTATALTGLPGYDTLPAEQQALLQRLTASGSDSTVTAIAPTGQQVEFTNIVSLSEAEQATATEALKQLLNHAAANPEDLTAIPDADAGTSFAAAKVTGAASQVWAANPDLSPEEVKALLKATATDVGIDGWDLATGAGLLNLGLAVQAAQDSAQVSALQPEATNGSVDTLLSAVHPEERPAFFKKIFRKAKSFVKKVFHKVVKVVSPVISVVKKVFGFVSKVGSFFSKAKSFFGKVSGFFKSIVSKFTAFPLLGKFSLVFSGISLIGGIGAGIYKAYKWYKAQKDAAKTVSPVVTTQIPSDILELDKIWGLYSSDQRSAIKAALNGGLTGSLAKYRPLFDGSDPDGIMPLVNTWGSLSASQQKALSYHIFNGLPVNWLGSFTATGITNPASVSDPNLKSTWTALTTEQRTVLLKFLKNQGVGKSAYGNPLMGGDPDGVTKILAAIGDSKLTDAQRNLLVSFMLHSGGVPTEYEGRFV